MIAAMRNKHPQPSLVSPVECHMQGQWVQIQAAISHQGEDSGGTRCPQGCVKTQNLSAQWPWHPSTSLCASVPGQVSMSLLPYPRENSFVLLAAYLSTRQT